MQASGLTIQTSLFLAAAQIENISRGGNGSYENDGEEKEKEEEEEEEEEKRREEKRRIISLEYTRWLARIRMRMLVPWRTEISKLLPV